MNWLICPALIAVGIVVFVPILVVAAVMVVLGGALHTGGRVIWDWIIDLVRRGEAWLKKGDAL